MIQVRKLVFIRSILVLENHILLEKDLLKVLGIFEDANAGNVDITRSV